VAKLYLSQKNYRGAESRLEDALAAKPHDPEATFLWAESLERLNQASDAMEAYRDYLGLEPQGKFGPKAQRALKRLEQKSAAK
jgi:Tfp pilus assembly protein PilF